MKEHKNRIRKIACYVLGDLYHSSQKWFIIDLIMNLLVSIFALTTTLMFQLVFDSINDSITNNAPTNRVLVYMIALSLFIVLRRFVDIMCNYTGTGALAKNAKKYIQEKIHIKMNSIPTVMFEDNKMLDTLAKVNECSEKGYGVYCGISLLATFFIPYICIMTGYYFWVLKPLALITVVIVVTQFIVQKFKYRFQVQMEEETLNLRRQIGEYETYLYDNRYYKDTVLYDLFDHYLDKWKKLVIQYNCAKRKFERKSLLINVLEKVISIIGYIIIIYIMYINLINDGITVGAFAAVFSSLGALFGMVEGIICFPVQRLSDSLANVTFYYDFMHTDFENANISQEDIKEITLHNVSFKYPNTDHNSLKNVSLSLRENEVVALVGPNGSGKSTLARILGGLYKPSEGEISINGKKLPAGENNYLKISAAFQNFQKYKLSLRNNISISDVDSSTDVEKFLESANIKLELDNANVDTSLSKEFGGVELSGGEWQKIAILRALFREHSVILLDEPTASIDPVEETNIYKKFLENEESKIVILLTHRIGAAKFADNIIVLNEGSIVEQGTHDELLKNEGLYHSLYEEQAKWYS